MWVFKPTVVGMTWRTESLTGSQLARIATQGSPYLYPAPLVILQSSEDALQSGPVMALGYFTGLPFPSPPEAAGGSF